MKKILAIITLLFLFTLTTFKASAMSLQMHAHQNNSHFITNHVVSNMQNNHSSKKVKSTNDSASTQNNDQQTQENSRLSQSHEQISNSQTQLGFFSQFVYVAVCIMLFTAFALLFVLLLIEIIR